MCAFFVSRETKGGYMTDKYMKEALKEARKSLELDEVPVGAIIVYQDKIIARAHNLKEHKKNAVAHAEILAIEKACKKIGDWRLNECTMYVTLEPCLMCCGAIIQARIGKLVYSLTNQKFGYVESVDQVLTNPKNNHKIQLEKIDDDESAQLLKSFFQKKRKSPLNSKSKSV